MDFAGDGVAANAQFLGCLNAPATGVEQGRFNQLGLKTPGQHLPNIAASAFKQCQCFDLETGFLAQRFIDSQSS